MAFHWYCYLQPPNFQKSACEGDLESLHLWAWRSASALVGSSNLPYYRREDASGSELGYYPIWIFEFQ